MADKKDEKDEAVNGPKIAALILSRMKGAQKERIVKAIQNSDPAIATKIEENLFNFDEIADLPNASVQVLLQNISPKDLVVSLKTASEKVKTIIFLNMSERKQQIVKDDFQALAPTRLSDVEEAQRRILGKLDELRTAGLLRTQSKNDIWV